MDQITHRVRAEEWKAIIEQCQARPEGQTAKQWLADNGISDKTYYYWLRKLRRQAYDELAQTKEVPAVVPDKTTPVALAEIPAEVIMEPERYTAVTIRLKRSTIEISNAVSDSLIVNLVKAVANAL